MDVINVTLGQKFIGQIEADVFTKHIVEKDHLLREPPAIAYDTSIVRGLVHYGVRLLVVYAMDTKRTYQADLATLQEKGFVFDRGAGEQIGLPLEFWEVRIDDRDEREDATSSAVERDESRSSARDAGSERRFEQSDFLPPAEPRHDTAHIGNEIAAGNPRSN